jgi:WD40 repeat protein
VFDYKKMKQLYYGGGKTDFGGRKQDDESKDGHSDDVTALCLSADRKMVASGQNGQKPLIFIWNAVTAENMKKKRMTKGCRLVTAIGFSPSGKYIAASDAAEKITVYLFAVEGGVNKVADVAINMKIVHLAFSPHDDNVFATAGKDHVAICTFDGKDKIKNVKGKPGKGGKIESQCSASFANDPKHKGVLFTGGSDGKVYVWKGD